jgi:methionyl-tRNA formyltransferase
VYLGTPEAAVPPLRALVGAGFDVALVISQPDRRRGRGGALTPSPVKQAALALGLPVSARVDDLLEPGVDAELGVVVAFGRLIRPHVLERVPMVNVHFSLLPRWRGAAPVERAIMAGDDVTGVCVMQLEAGLDTGPVHAIVRTPIGPDETAEELRGRLVELGTGLLLESLTNGLGDPAPQLGEPTYAEKIDPAEMEIDWTQPALDVHRLVRLGRAWTTFRGRRLRVLRARVQREPTVATSNTLPPPGTLDGVLVAANDGWLELVTVQPEGRAPQAADAWRNGARPFPAERMDQ